ncbi:nuclear transport factor 2 family protein [Georgenia sp. AZ-5]|uniref:nuclear transport factor 2 family protein n=1 Tax=Georgenia sp. AZ-5 TaxID=3367526 RepID=UPI00375432CD
MVTKTSSPEHVARTFASATASGDVDIMQQLLADDATWWIPGELPVSGTWTGHDEIFGRMFATAGQHIAEGTLKIEVSKAIADESHCVLLWQAQAESVHGHRYSNQYCMVFEVRDGKIVSVREYIDTAPAKRALFPA